MKKVCFVMHSDLFTPWPVVRAMREIQILKEKGYDISVVSWIKEASDLPPTEERDGIKVHRFLLQPPKKGFLKRLFIYRKALRGMSRKVMELKPDAIVCHDLEILNAGVKAKKTLKVPLFYDAHENWPAMVAENSRFEARFFDFLEKRLLRHVTHSYTYGDDLTEKFKGMGFFATTLYNSKSIDAVPSIAEAEIVGMKKQLGLEESDFVVGFAGSVSLENGAQQVIDCLKNLPENVKFLVVGGSGREEDLKKVKRYAIEKEVQDRVIMTGRVQSDALLKYTATFDLGTALFQPLNPNQVARVPNKLFDYMALSVPMLVSDFPNMRRIVVEESDCGLAVDPMNIGKIAQAIRNFYDNPVEAKKKGENGRTKFEELYSWDVQKKKLIASHPLWRGEG
ncbi:MAG: glycosyltransferase family 4 protein [Thermoplasmata archaeon]